MYFTCAYKLYMTLPPSMCSFSDFRALKKIEKYSWRVTIFENAEYTYGDNIAKHTSPPYHHLSK